jgi:uncharacterized phiE125 gp8 family phage protein
MSFYESFGAPQETKLKDGFQLERTVDSVAEPITAAEFKTHAKITQTSSELDAQIARLLPAARRQIEKFINKTIIQQTWTQTHDTIGRKIRLRQGPVPTLGIVSVKTINSYTAGVEWDTVDPDDYFEAGKWLVARDSWPCHRGFQSFEITYNVGFSALVVGANQEAIDAAVASVSQDLKEACLELATHYYGDPYGEGPEQKYQATADQTGPIPAGIAGALQGYIDWSLKG